MCRDKALFGIKRHVPGGAEKLLHPAKSTISQCKKHHFTTRYAPYCITKWCLSDDERVLFAKYLNSQHLSVSPECHPPTTFLKCHYVVARASAATLCHLLRRKSAAPKSSYTLILAPPSMMQATRSDNRKDLLCGAPRPISRRQKRRVTTGGHKFAEAKHFLSSCCFSLAHK